MSEHWVILTGLNQVEYYGPHGKLTANRDEAEFFHSEEAARRVASTLKTPTTVHYVNRDGSYVGTDKLWVLQHNKTGWYFGANNNPRTEVGDAVTYNTEEEAIKAINKLPGPVADNVIVLSFNRIDLQPSSPEVPKLKVPVPDFFEQTYQMSLEDMVALLQVECLVDVFTPVDNITGANQMTGSGIYDLEAENGAFIGARYEFSFDQILSDDDIKRFHTDDSLIEGWKSGAYRVKRNGFTSYGHLVLIRDMTN